MSANCLIVLRETDGLQSLANKRTVYKLLNRIKAGHARGATQGLRV